MQVRPRGSPTASADTDQLAGFDLVALLHFEVGQVEIQTEESLAVIDDYAPTLEIKSLGKNYGPSIDCMHRRPARRGEIQAQMAALHFLVEHSSRSEHIRDRR